MPIVVDRMVKSDAVEVAAGHWLPRMTCMMDKLVRGVAHKHAYRETVCEARSKCCKG